MKLIILLAVVAVTASRPDDYTRYENFDVDAIADNVPLLKSYCDCFHGTGVCTPDGSYFKKWIGEAVQDNCRKCTEKQKTPIAKLIVAIRKLLPEETEKLTELYNPGCIYDSTEFIEKYGH